MNAPTIRRWDRETLLLICLAACVSLAALIVCAHRDYILLYGDAVAHINIARRVFDSKTPGLLQLGTVWLPLPHLLILPFVIPSKAWHDGVTASIPCLFAYVFGALGIFRLLRGCLSRQGAFDRLSRLAAWFGAAIYALNPNLLYLQSTAMTEPLYLGLFIWAIVFFLEFVRAVRADIQTEAANSLRKCGLCVAAAELTRYDGWFLAGVLVVAAGWESWTANRPTLHRPKLRIPLRTFVLIVAVMPVAWLCYNGLVYRNPLEFANGPYSARAIERRTSTPGNAHPGTHNLIEATQYFVKAGELNLAEGHLQKFWVVACFAAALFIVLRSREFTSILLLWLPLPFYAWSIAYGSIPIFIPTWWPFSYYNVRYGIQLLPAAAVFVALAAYFVASFAAQNFTKVACFAGFAILTTTCYLSVWRASPICLREASINARTRIELEKALASQLRLLPRDSTILMYLGEHVGALQNAGIPLRRTINEADHRTWKQPADPDGLWERALANPSHYVDYAVAVGRDPVAIAMQKTSALPVAAFDVSGQPHATIYSLRPISGR